MKLKWGDFIVIILIAVVTIAMFIFGVPKKAGDTVVAQITVDGDVVEVINLDDIIEEKEILLLNGEVKILAQKGKIRFEESDCPNHVCVNTGWIDSPGQVAACLPNKVLVKLIGKTDEVDVVVR